MALNRKPSPERPDHTTATAGSSGEITAQEPGSGKPVHRRGGDESQADIDVGTVASPVDLTTGDFNSGQRNVGGAEALAGDLISDDTNTFTVEVDWLDDDNNVTRTYSPSALTDVTEIQFNLIVRSDRFEVRVTDTSGGAQNNVHGSVNAH